MLKKSEMFHTPANQEELAEWINRHAPSDRPHLWTAAMMAWNLAAELTSKKEE